MLNSITVSGKTLANKPAPKVPKWVDKYLLKLGGKTPYGDPYLKLVWGQSERRYNFGECPFHGYCGGMRIKYLAATAVVELPQVFNKETNLLERVFEHVDIGKQRFIIEEWWPPNLLRKGWDSKEMGAFPQKGMWRSFMVLETPDCKFRMPDKECMDWVGEVWQKRQEARLTQDPNEPMPEKLWQWEMEKAYTESLEEQEKRKAKIEDRLRSVLAPHIKRLMHPHPNEGRGY